MEATLKIEERKKGYRWALVVDDKYVILGIGSVHYAQKRSARRAGKRAAEEMGFVVTGTVN